MKNYLSTELDKLALHKLSTAVYTQLVSEFQYLDAACKQQDDVDTWKRTNTTTNAPAQNTGKPILGQFIANVKNIVGVRQNQNHPVVIQPTTQRRSFRDFQNKSAQRSNQANNTQRTPQTTPNLNQQHLNDKNVNTVIQEMIEARNNITSTRSQIVKTKLEPHKIRINSLHISKADWKKEVQKFAPHVNTDDLKPITDIGRKKNSLEKRNGKTDQEIARECETLTDQLTQLEEEVQKLQEKKQELGIIRGKLESPTIGLPQFKDNKTDFDTAKDKLKNDSDQLKKDIETAAKTIKDTQAEINIFETFDTWYAQLHRQTPPGTVTTIESYDKGTAKISIRDKQGTEIKNIDLKKDDLMDPIKRRKTIKDGLDGVQKDLKKANLAAEKKRLKAEYEILMPSMDAITLSFDVIESPANSGTFIGQIKGDYNGELSGKISKKTLSLITIKPLKPQNIFPGKVRTQINQQVHTHKKAEMIKMIPAPKSPTITDATIRTTIGCIDLQKGKVDMVCAPALESHRPILDTIRDNLKELNDAIPTRVGAPLDSQIDGLIDNAVQWERACNALQATLIAIEGEYDATNKRHTDAESDLETTVDRTDTLHSISSLFPPGYTHVLNDFDGSQANITISEPSGIIILPVHLSESFFTGDNAARKTFIEAQIESLQAQIESRNTAIDASAFEEEIIAHHFDIDIDGLLDELDNFSSGESLGESLEIKQFFQKELGSVFDVELDADNSATIKYRDKTYTVKAVSLPPDNTTFKLTTDTDEPITGAEFRKRIATAYAAEANKNLKDSFNTESSFSGTITPEEIKETGISYTIRLQRIAPNGTVNRNVVGQLTSNANDTPLRGSFSGQEIALNAATLRRHFESTKSNRLILEQGINSQLDREVDFDHVVAVLKYQGGDMIDYTTVLQFIFNEAGKKNFLENLEERYGSIQNAMLELSTSFLPEKKRLIPNSNAIEDTLNKTFHKDHFSVKNPDKNATEITYRKPIGKPPRTRSLYVKITHTNNVFGANPLKGKVSVSGVEQDIYLSEESLETTVQLLILEEEDKQIDAYLIRTGLSRAQLLQADADVGLYARELTFLSKHGKFDDILSGIENDIAQLKKFLPIHDDFSHREAILLHIGKYSFGFKKKRSILRANDFANDDKHGDAICDILIGRSIAKLSKPKSILSSLTDKKKKNAIIKILDTLKGRRNITDNDAQILGGYIRANKNITYPLS